MSIRREGYGRPVIICTAGDDSIAVFFSLSLVRYATTLAAERERIYNNFRRSLTRAPGGKQMVVVVFFFRWSLDKWSSEQRKKTKGTKKKKHNLFGVDTHQSLSALFFFCLSRSV